MTRLFYDGGCGLCRGTVRFAARHDRLGRIRFAPLGGTTFLRMIPASSRVSLPDSLVVLTPEGELLTRSEAVIHLLRRMGPVWNLGGIVLGWIPGPLRDAGYRLVARLRPRKRACPLEAPGPERFDP